MTRLPRRHRCDGFTLLEMLVVVLIIGMLVVGAILSLGATGRDSQLQQERDRLDALIAYTRDRGSLMATEYGIRCGEHGYRFVYYDNLSMQWLPETLDDTLRLRHLPNGLDLQLSIEGRSIVLDDNALQFDASAAALPPALGGVPGTGASANGPSANGPSANGSSGTDTSAEGASGTGVAGSALGAPSDLNGPATDNTPQIMLFSNGDTNSFVLTIERPSARRSVSMQSNSDGTISAGQIVQAAQ